VIDPQNGRAWCDGPRHVTGERPRASVQFTAAGGTTASGHLCPDCAEQAAAQFARSIADAAAAAGMSAIGGTISVSPVPQ
jgi:hypothetical protein